ncbi:MAG TPA: hypothetical protein VMP03_00620 [Methylomirabilota bacterium]|nr:hypothetical protein [Methylomirabilota bacterium]
MTEDTALLRRFLRTVRVATHTALAEYEIGEGRRHGAAPVRFHALAAKGADGWRFPDAGLAAADGLVTATLERDEAGAPATLVLQAQGSAGLDVYAGRSGRVAFGQIGPDADVAFDADGRATVTLAGLGVDEDDLAAFQLSLVEAR